ncbi:MAG: leucine-rich repeat domain-containing protein, partial [Candidatus Kariarchaeaceae archaeon]
KKLDLHGNKIQTVSDQIKHLQNLELLVLSSNDIVELPQGICELAKLEELRLSSNQRRLRQSLTRLPDNIGKLSNLKSLSLYNNDLSVLPESFSNLSNLEYLNLEANFNLNWPIEYFCSFKKIKTLSLQQTKCIEKLPNCILSLKHLERLSANTRLVDQKSRDIGILLNKDNKASFYPCTDNQ